MNKKLIIGLVILIVAIIAVLLFFSTRTSNSTGATIATQDNSEAPKITGKQLIGECISRCGGNANTALEKEVWKSICNQKYNQGEEKIREFINIC